MNIQQLILKHISGSLVCILILLLVIPPKAQEGTLQRSTLQQIVFPSPTVASLGKYGEYKVGGSSGVPNISIPLLEVKGMLISVPISLSYHGSGSKVSDIASWVGLGWSLNAGGVIARTVIGREDGFPAAINSLYAQGFDPNGFLAEDNLDDYTFFRAVAKGGWTADPDRYSFNVMGMSGQFFVLLDGSVHLFSCENLSIELIKNLGRIEKFIVKDGNGTTYVFESKERTYVEHNTTCSTIESASTYTSAWYLSTITKGNESFIFIYDTENLDYDFSHSGSQSIPLMFTDCIGLEECLSFSNMFIEKRKLARIIGPFGAADFTSNKGRNDLQGGTSLETISYLDQVVTFNTSAQQSSYGGRLILDSVDVVAGTEDVKTFEFIYNSIVLPRRDSYQVDHYGYYNGNNNSTFYPQYSPEL